MNLLFLEDLFNKFNYLIRTTIFSCLFTIKCLKSIVDRILIYFVHVRNAIFIYKYTLCIQASFPFHKFFKLINFYFRCFFFNKLFLFIILVPNIVFFLLN